MFSVVLVALFVSVFGITYWGISESEMKVPSIEYLELSKAPFKPVVGQNISLHAFPAARNSDFGICGLLNLWPIFLRHKVIISHEQWNWCNFPSWIE